MAIKLLTDLGASKVALAGFDGYAYDPQENYAEGQVSVITARALTDAINRGMAEVLRSFEGRIEFVTDPVHYRL